MSKDKMIYTTEDDKAVIICSECDKLKQIPVEKFKGKKHLLKIRCSCGSEFQIKLNFRKGIRKKVKLKGRYRTLSQHHSAMEECTVVDLSFKGLRLKFFDSRKLKIDDKLFVHFTLDNEHKTIVKRKIQICNIIDDNSIGAKFIDTELDNYDKQIGFYLMS